MVSEKSPALRRGSRLDAFAQSRAIEEIVAQDQTGRRTGEEFLPDCEGLGQPLRLGLLSISELDAEGRTITEQFLEARQIPRRRNDQNFPHPAEHEHAQWVVDHRLVEYREKLLGDGGSARVQPRAAAAGENDSFAFHFSKFSVVQCSVFSQATSGGRASPRAATRVHHSNLYAATERPGTAVKCAGFRVKTGASSTEADAAIHRSG